MLCLLLVSFVLAFPGFVVHLMKCFQGFFKCSKIELNPLWRSVSLALLRATTPKPKATERPPEPQAIVAGEGDPIRLARGKRGFVFRAFTSLACWGGEGNGSPQWIQFDFAAFEEALKTLHQVDDKAREREDERNQKQAQHDYQRDTTKKWKGGATGEDEQRPPVLAGDPRIERLEELLRSDLAEEYAMSEGLEVQYGLHPRTIRGFREIRKKWNEAMEPGQSYNAVAREQLWKLLTDYKRENSENIGSPAVLLLRCERPDQNEPSLSRQELSGC